MPTSLYCTPNPLTNPIRVDLWIQAFVASGHVLEQEVLEMIPRKARTSLDAY